MKDIENNALFWQKLDTLFISSKVAINRPKDMASKTYPNLVYPVDYGYLEDTTGSANKEVDVFLGTLEDKRIQSMAIGTDILRKTVEVKLIAGCTDTEKKSILEFLNQMEFQKAIIINRSDNVPDWSDDD